MKNDFDPGLWAAKSLDEVETGHISVKSKYNGKSLFPLGLRTLSTANKRNGLIYVPKQNQENRPMPLALVFHEAGANAKQAIDLLQRWADFYGTILVAPDSRGRTWDLIIGDFGPDVTYINRTLNQVFKENNIDKNKIAIAGFSDGGSYALSLGLASGEFFSHIIAFSPAFMAPAFRLGSPEVFISHGKLDPIFPIEQCSRPIVRTLEKQGYKISYHEFNGSHAVPLEISQEAMQWFIGIPPLAIRKTS
jgi:predicted esterase